MIKKLLIIEDDEDMCRELNEALTDFGCYVQTAFDGLTGKKLIEKNKYDIIVVDLKIPKLNGYQILNFINKKKIISIIIVITAKMKMSYENILNKNRDRSEADLLKSANFILKKPFKINDLISIIKKI